MYTAQVFTFVRIGGRRVAALGMAVKHPRAGELVGLFTHLRYKIFVLFIRDREILRLSVCVGFSSSGDMHVALSAGPRAWYKTASKLEVGLSRESH